MKAVNHSRLMSILSPYLDPNAKVFLDGEQLPTCELPPLSESMKANSDFFGHPVWGKEYFETSHRHEIFRDRWLAATGTWDQKVDRKSVV